MWNPNVAPVYSFERYARIHGVHRARERWKRLEERHRAAQHAAHLHELEMARAAEKRGPYIVNEDMGEVAYQVSPNTFVELHRSSLHERGAVGGELLKDDDYMRFFLKRNPECARKSVSGNIMRGWTPHDLALERAAHERKLAERVPIMSAMAVIEEAAKKAKPNMEGCTCHEPGSAHVSKHLRCLHACRESHPGPGDRQCRTR